MPVDSVMLEDIVSVGGCGVNAAGLRLSIAAEGVSVKLLLSSLKCKKTCSSTPFRSPAPSLTPSSPCSPLFFPLITPP